MSFVFSPIFVADTKIIFRYHFVAPLIVNILFKLTSTFKYIMSQNGQTQLKNLATNAVRFIVRNPLFEGYGEFEKGF